MMHTHTYSNDRQNGETYNCDDAECPVNTYGQHKLYGATDVGEGRPRPASSLANFGTCMRCGPQSICRCERQPPSDNWCEYCAKSADHDFRDHADWASRQGQNPTATRVLELEAQLAAREEALRGLSAKWRASGPMSPHPMKMQAYGCADDLDALLAQYNGEGGE